MALETGVHVSRRRVDEKAEAAQRALSLQTSHQVIRQLDVLHRGPEDELPWMQDEGLLFLDLDHLGQILHRQLHVDEGMTGVVKGPEEAVDVQVHRRRLNVSLVERLDTYVARSDRCADVPVGEDHRGATI